MQAKMTVNVQFQTSGLLFLIQKENKWDLEVILDPQFTGSDGLALSGYVSICVGLGEVLMKHYTLGYFSQDLLSYSHKKKGKSGLHIKHLLRQSTQ